MSWDEPEHHDYLGCTNLLCNLCYAFKRGMVEGAKSGGEDDVVAAYDEGYEEGERAARESLARIFDAPEGVWTNLHK